MTRRHVGRADHREGRGRQNGLRRYPGTQLVQGAIENLAWGRVLDKLDQRFDSVGKPDTLRHRHGGFSLSTVLLFCCFSLSLGGAPFPACGLASGIMRTV